MSVWDDPEFKQGGEFVAFDAPGDTVSGVINAIRKHTFPATQTAPAKTVPQILLTCDDGEERTVTAGQMRLLAALSEQKPEVGDHITITLTQIEKRQGGRTLKHFDLQVKKGAPAAPATAQAPF